MQDKGNVTTLDRPISSSSLDHLERGPFVGSLIRSLVTDRRDDKGQLIGRRATGYVVGLTGRWGLGKSSVLNLIYEELDAADHVVVASFNPWLFHGRDELVTGFFTSLRAAMGRSRSEEARDLVNALNRYWGAVDLAAHGAAAVLDLYGASGAATSAWTKWGKQIRNAFASRPRTPDQERVVLEQKIAQANCAVVVLIDELDRVEDDEVRAVAQLVKAVGDIQGVSYLVAYDPSRVVDALGRGAGVERRETGERYLEKIIQHPIPLRPLFAEDTRALLQKTLVSYRVELGEATSEHQRTILDLIVDAIETPREIKRLVGAFSILEHAVRREICNYDVLGYCWLLTKAPSLRDQIAAHIDELVSDPGPRALADRVVRRMNKEEDATVVDVLGEAAIAHRKILECLFPRFVEEEASGRSDGDQLSRRRNLVRMIYLGNPPGLTSRVEIEQLWGEGHPQRTELCLRRLIEEDKFGSLIDRLDDVLASLPEEGDSPFWTGLSAALVRQSDWLLRPEAASRFADDAAETLFRLGERDARQRPRVRRIVDELIRSGDLVITPWVLRKHLFAHGLTRHDGSSRGRSVFDRDETQALLARELPRYRSAVLSGVALRRLPTAEALFVLLNTRNWDEELRASLTSQLSTADAISTIAALLVPPGYRIDRTTLDELFEAKTVHERLEQLEPQAKSSDAWIIESLRRLERILADKNPDYSTWED